MLVSCFAYTADVDTFTIFNLQSAMFNEEMKVVAGKKKRKINEYFVPDLWLSNNQNDTSNDTSGIIREIPNNQLLNL